MANPRPAKVTRREHLNVLLTPWLLSLRVVDAM